MNFLKACPLLLLAAAASAQVTYTKEQLAEMEKKGTAPEQGDVRNTQSRPMEYAACRAAVAQIVDAVGDYPKTVAADTALMYMVKIWTNNGAVTATCSQPDRTLVITEAAYK